jgi:D-3-phosphoglycerate dehydrogenase
MPEPPNQIVITEPYNDDAVEKLRCAGNVLMLPSCDSDTILSALPNAHALLIRTRTKLTGEMIEAATQLKVIGRGGVGLDNIDLDAARRKGIAVVHTPAASTQAVAELTVALALMLIRHIPASQSLLRAGEFERGRSENVGCEMADLTTGIVGMGRIGSTVGRLMSHGFKGRVIYNDIRPVGSFDFPAEPVSLTELLHQADLVTLHVPLNESTRHLIQETTLNEMKPSAMLINTSRGGVVKTAALIDALTNNRIAGAALDVFENEPPDPVDALFSIPNLIATPHIASRTERSLAAMNNVVDDVIAVLNGKSPKYPALES